MSDMTMGQRIAQRRKLLNLSQEALGEKLGVSRQAISKWEADGAIPEIDKLISMSKLFDVTVGWLLGTEEDTQKLQPEEFSEAQLKIVEEIVRRYTRQEPDPAQSQDRDKGKRKRKILICVAVIVLLLVGFRYYQYMNSVVTGVNNSVSSLYYFYNNLSSQMLEISHRMDELTAGPRLLSEYTLEAEAWEDLSGATVRFSGMRSTTQDGDEGRLSVWLDGVEVASVPCTLTGGLYSAKVDLPAANGYKFYFHVLHTGGDSSQQRLDKTNGCSDLKSVLTGHMYMEFEKISTQTYPGNWSKMEGLELFYVEPKLVAGSGKLQIQDMCLVLTSGTEILERIPLLEKGEACERNGYVTDFRDMTPFHFRLDMEIPEGILDREETVLSVELVLNNGTVVEQALYRWYRENGSLETEFMAPFS